MSQAHSHFWQPWRRHWLFVVGLFTLGPTCGYLLADDRDRGLVFGLAISIFASAWLLWSQHEREVEK